MKSQPLGRLQLALLDEICLFRPEPIITTEGERELYLQAEDLAEKTGKPTKDVQLALDGLVRRGHLEQHYLPDCPEYIGYKWRSAYGR